jgi:ribonuclease HI
LNTAVTSERGSMKETDGEWFVLIDGAVQGYPGVTGCGAAIFDESGAVVKALSRYLGCLSNNVAEYEGLLMGLQALIQIDKKRICVLSDSQLLVRQLNGAYRVKDEKLKMLFKRAVNLLRHFDAYRILHARIESNTLADRLANRGIDDVIGS